MDKKINQNSVLMFLKLEMKQVINTGKEVVTYTDLISVSGCSGAGCIIFDPDSGSGLYKI
ncbi:MAG TPA: hypothetical protein ENJ08_05975 [Gammaproteobacteria bacterium]|nr:hypothetical protein [Gammaproteobacteria bacterium]